MKISNHTTIAGEKVNKIVSAIGDVKEIEKEAGGKFSTLASLDISSHLHNKKESGFSL
ncbi:MAG: hypothetical protein WCR30_00750 [Clostridia bacterium]